MSSTQRRFSGVDGLRGLAAVGVILVHVWMYTGARDPGHPVLLDAVIGELRLGLVYFFVLSGFLLAAPWLRAALDGRPGPHLGSYALHRAARILPAYWFALIGAFAILAGTGHPREVSADALPIFAVFAQNQVAQTAGQLNPPTWSLSVEVGFYLLLPLAGWLTIRAARAWGRAGAVAVGLALVAAGLGWTMAGQLGEWPRTMTTSPLTYLPVFAAGLVAAALAHGRAPGRRAALALLATGSAAVVANGVWHSDGTGLAGHVLLDLPAAAGFAAIVVALTARPPGMLDTWPVRGLGTISYGTYLWHMPVMYWLITRDLFPEGPWAAFALVAVLSLALGALSWAAVEKPVLERLRRGRRAKAPRRFKRPPEEAVAGASSRIAS